MSTFVQIFIRNYLGLLFSSCSQRSSTALMLSMFFWVAFVLVWPNASAYVTSKLLPLASDRNLGADSSWQQQYRRELGRLREDHAPKRMAIDGSISVDSNGYMTYLGRFDGSPEDQSQFLEYVRRQEGLRIHYAEKEGQVWQEYLRRNPIRQAHVAQQLARISPAAAYAHAAAVLAGTDLESHLQFLDQARQYRYEMVQYLREQKAFGSPAWYDPEVGKTVDTDGIPLFHERAESLSSSLQRASLDLLMLVLLNGGLFLLSYLSFLRYDVR